MAVPRRHLVLAFAILAALLAGAYAASLRPWTPVADEIEYLAYARTLALSGSYAATPAGPAADAVPGREPAYATVLAALILIDPSLGKAVTTCLPPDASCAALYRDIRYLNAGLIALAAVLVLLTAQVLGATPAASLVAGSYVLLNLQMNKTATHAISDYLALALAAALSLVLVRFAREPRRTAWLCGLALAALVLTKAIYAGFAVLFLGGAAVHGLSRLRHRGARALVPAVTAAAIVIAAAGGWAARNVAWYGHATDSRDAIGLSGREAYDHMTSGEHAAAFLWWTRGVGERLARQLLPETAWHRHELYADDGLYMQGHVHGYEARVTRLMHEKGLGRRDAEAAVSGLILHDILADWPAYLATMPAVFYRGLWFDEFIVFGFPALCWLLVRCIRRRDGTTLLALSPGLFSLLAYAALSFNIPRYQFTAAPALAIAAGLAAEALLQRCRVWRHNSRPISRSTE